jgi:hypothetical protein
MLDLTKLTRQLQGISQHLTQEVVASRQRSERAQQLLAQATSQQEKFVKQQEKWRDRLCFSPPTPVESLDTRVYLDVPPATHTVIATDGSQMAPSHHEIAYCYLINIGRVILHYGQSLHPLLDSVPELCYQPEELYVSRQWGIGIEEWMGYQRTVSEAKALAELACNWVNPPNSARGSNGKSLKRETNQQSKNPKSKIHNPQSQVPALAMVDGTLIYWFLEQLPVDACDRILSPILDTWNQLRDCGIPLMGYLSASRSSDSLSFLRLPACKHPNPDCKTYCRDFEKKPCQVTEPLRDAILWASQLQPGQRGCLWRGGASILDLYESHHHIYFCYVHVGTEIARIEVPAWVAENSALLNQALGLMLAQVHKGYGYPVALAEAHNQAVVRGGDRVCFYALLEQQLIKEGLRNVGTSYKEARKRGSIA